MRPLRLSRLAEGDVLQWHAKPLGRPLALPEVAETLPNRH
jgi:hypothetical protein